MAKFYSFFVTLCLVQLCLSAPAAESKVVKISELNTLAGWKPIENLSTEEILGLIKVWDEESKKPNITQIEKDGYTSAMVGAIFMVAARNGELDD